MKISNSANNTLKKKLWTEKDLFTFY